MRVVKLSRFDEGINVTLGRSSTSRTRLQCPLTKITEYRRANLKKSRAKFLREFAGLLRAVASILQQNANCYFWGYCVFVCDEEFCGLSSVRASHGVRS